MNGTKRGQAASSSSSSAKRTSSKGPKSGKRQYRKFTPNLGLAPSSTSGAANRIYTKLRYAGLNQSVDNAAGVGAIRSYRLNSLFDPELTGGGNQPYRYDQYVNLGYTNYIVHAVKCVIIPQFATNPNTGVPMLLCRIDMGGAVSVGNAQLEIQRSFKYMFPDNMGQNSGATFYNSTIQTPRHIKFYRKLKTLSGVPKLDYNNDGAAVGNNPVVQAVLSVVGHDAKETNALENRFQIILTYYCEFFNTFAVGLS